MTLLSAASCGKAETPPADPVTARLVSESAVLVPGTVARLGVLFDIAPGWHLFWDGCNDTGSPIAVTPRLPDGFEARPLQWPAPERLVSPGDILDHVYARRVLLVLPVEVPGGLRAGSRVTLACSLEWVRCREACVFGADTVSIELPVAPETRPDPAAALFAAADARIPRPFDRAGGAIRAVFEKGVLAIEAPGADSLAFFPQAGCETLMDRLADGAARGGRIQVRYRPVNGRIEPPRGVLRVSKGQEPPLFFGVDLNTSEPGTSDAPVRP